MSVDTNFQSGVYSAIEISCTWLCAAANSVGAIAPPLPTASISHTHLPSVLPVCPLCRGACGHCHHYNCSNLSGSQVVSSGESRGWGGQGPSKDYVSTPPHHCSSVLLVHLQPISTNEGHQGDQTLTVLMLRQSSYAAKNKTKKSKSRSA